MEFASQQTTEDTALDYQPEHWGEDCKDKEEMEYPHYSVFFVRETNMVRSWNTSCVYGVQDGLGRRHPISTEQHPSHVDTTNVCVWD